ncbi:hypothetical protein T484DRAFT_1743578 [Baffinella frigidus]|nr:hypothetical protein T484DRAFT_1743578 [Cryptophyta sp. CCMP2293]
MSEQGEDIRLSKVFNGERGRFPDWLQDAKSYISVKHPTLMPFIHAAEALKEGITEGFKDCLQGLEASGLTALPSKSLTAADVKLLAKDDEDLEDGAEAGAPSAALLKARKARSQHLAMAEESLYNLLITLVDKKVKKERFASIPDDAQDKGTQAMTKLLKHYSSMPKEIAASLWMRAKRS